MDFDQTDLSVDEYHYKIGSFYEANTRQLVALAAFLRALEWNPTEQRYQEKLLSYWEMDSEWVLGSLKKNIFTMESKTFATVQGYINYILGIIAFYKDEFDKAKTLFSDITQNEYNITILNAFILSCLWHEEKDYDLNQYNISTSLVIEVNNINRSWLLKKISNILKVNPYLGLLIKEKERLEE